MSLVRQTQLVALLGLSASVATAGPISFRDQIAPLLEKHCFGCHSGERAKGDLDLTTRAKLLEGGASGPALVPGRPNESRLVRLVADGKMPPKAPLDVKAVEVLRQWVADGAEWDGGPLRAAVASGPKRSGADWWSLQPIRRPPVPSGTNSHNPIDAFVQTGLDRAGVVANPAADRRSWIRRVTLDLTGLWPSADEVAAFERDPSHVADEHVVDRLLASPAYGERWGRHWLDVVRFAESHGYEMNTLRPNAWPYRDYVIRAFNRDTPFADFVREQLAGDTIPGADPLTQAATGFLVAGAHDLVGNETEEGKRQQRSDDLFDMVSTTSATFLGLTAGCARCHDHKFDPITQKDFYALEAFFAGVQHAERPVGEPGGERTTELASLRSRLLDLDRRLGQSEPIASRETMAKPTRAAVNARRNVERIEPTDVRFVRFTVRATNDGTQPCIDELELYAPDFAGGNLAVGAMATASSEYPNAAIHKTAHLTDGRHGNGRSWISNEPGRGWTQIELPRAVRLGFIVWGRDREQKYKDRLATDYRIEVSTNGMDWQPVAGSWDRGATADPDVQRRTAERDALLVRIAELEKPRTVYAGAFATPGPTRLLKRGDVMQPGETVAPAAVRGIGKATDLAATAADPDRRQALAAWLTAPDNPLPARVMVNRVWHYHFGQGLVRTPSDFGFNGDRPSHPELLDWLATEFQANGGRLKPLHRLIVLSQTYRRSSRIEPANAKVDASNRFLWRFPSRRIEAEAVRDNILQTSGALNRLAGGPGYNLWTYSNYVLVFTPKASLGPDEFRRMVYQFKPRAQQDGTFGAFDCPDATAAVPRRSTSTTALQALNLLNDEFVYDQADRFAARVRAGGGDDAAQVAAAFRLAFQRDPTPTEAAAAAALARSAGLSTLCRMLLNANEFVTLE